MYILDTNVISEMRKTERGLANQNVVEWGRQVQASTLFLSVMTVLELEHGTSLMERRDPLQGRALRNWLDGLVYLSFANRIIPVNAEVARRCAALNVPAPRPDRDSLIAATALVHSMIVVTRNVADFAPMGVQVINPWTA